ncbi:hypothetical protein [Halomonas stenophila]|uniref:Uncharacterized protein n=1 Tax=Halomonas stenophila TaxID=795312 RepID=A0A7W5HJR5_9GAMM|nr:hypothetical protein [Halomonas stenophila]MBB3231145.1 hypothetical protein [Halomonas stenophila]
MSENMEPFILFREKARKLLESTFAKEMAKPTGLDISWTENGQVAVHRGPDQEAIDAYLLTFRFFIQGNESISFRNMEKSFRHGINDDDLFEKFKEAKGALNEFLDGDSHFNVNGMVSRRQLMDVFIYGDLSHANRQGKREHYKSWMNNEFMAELMRNEFKDIIGKTLIVIAHVDKLCKEAIERYGNT